MKRNGIAIVIVAVAGVFLAGISSPPTFADDKNKDNRGRGSQHKAINQSLSDRDLHAKRGTFHRTLNQNLNDDRDDRRIAIRKRVKINNGRRFHRTPMTRPFVGDLKRIHDEWHFNHRFDVVTPALLEEHRRLHVELNRRHQLLR